MKKLFLSLIACIMLLNFACFAEGWVLDGSNWKYQDRNGDYLTDQIKKSLDNSYYLDDQGNMVKDYLAEVNDNFYYFNENGEMVTNTWVAIDPSMIDDEYFEADAYFMYFGNNGRAIKGDGEGKIKPIDGKYYMFNESGIMMVGWLSEQGEHLDSEGSDDWYSSEAEYYAKEDGSLAEGWLELADYYIEDGITNAAGDIVDMDKIYFYFNPSTHKKSTGERTINGKKYRFYDDNGRMMSTWEYLEDQYGGGDDTFNAASASQNKYFNSYLDGSMAKNQWIYDVPSSVIDKDKYDDEEKVWFYTGGTGALTTNCIKKIKGKNYIFDKDGIMRTGLIVLYKGKFYCEIDREKTTYADFVKRYRFYPVEKDIENMVVEDESQQNYWYTRDELYTTDQMWDINGSQCQGVGYQNGGNQVRNFFLTKHVTNATDEDLDYANPGRNFTLKYFGEDGSEQIGSSMVPFPDGEFEFVSNTKGGYIDWHADKFYQNGFLMRSYGDNKYVFSYVGNVLPGTYYGGLWFKRFVNQKCANYSDFLMTQAGGNTENQVMYKFELAGYPGWMFRACPGSLNYVRAKNDPTKSVLQEVLGGARAGGVTQRFCFVTDKNGKKMKKGVYKDNGLYYLVNTDGNFVGVFNVPIKWGRKYVGWADAFIDGLAASGLTIETAPQSVLDANRDEFYINKTFDWPYYKSDLITGYDENGNEKIKSNAWIPFVDKDYKGRSELDFVEDLTDDMCGNLVMGTFDGKDDNTVSDVQGDGEQS